MMNRSVMNRQMFKKGGAAGFPDLSGDGKITRKDVLMGRGVEFKQDGGPAGRVPNDVQAIFNGLVNAMRGSKTDVAGYVAQNQQDLMDIAKMFPNTAPMIEEGFKTFMGMMGPGESVTESPLTTEENGRFNVYPPTQMQMGGEPMAAAMEQGNMAPAPMPANLGPAEMDGIASQVNPEVLAMLQGAARSFGDPEQAESFEEMMNMVRGVPATEEERRQELAGVVGPSDAQQTPDSVLALLQPTMLLMGLPETEVDTGGIGPMAQTAMDVPVQGDMAEGIMSMAAPASEGASPPVNFNQGGEVLRFENGGGVLRPIPGRKPFLSGQSGADRVYFRRPMEDGTIFPPSEMRAEEINKLEAVTIRFMEEGLNVGRALEKALNLVNQVKTKNGRRPENALTLTNEEITRISQVASANANPDLIASAAVDRGETVGAPIRLDPKTVAPARAVVTSNEVAGVPAMPVTSAGVPAMPLVPLPVQSVSTENLAPPAVEGPGTRRDMEAGYQPLAGVPAMPVTSNEVAGVPAMPVTSNEVAGVPAMPLVPLPGEEDTLEGVRTPLAPPAVEGPGTRRDMEAGYQPPPRPAIDERNNVQATSTSSGPELNNEFIRRLLLARGQRQPSLEQSAMDRLQVYKNLMGESDEQANKDLAQAQFFQDLARFGFGIMQPGKPGESFAAQAGRVGQETQIGQNTLNILAKQKAAKDQQDRALKLAAIQGAETERSAAIKASAAAKAARLQDERAALREWFKYKSSTSTKKSLGQSAVDGETGANIMLEEVINVVPTPGKVFSKTDGNYNFANSEIKRTIRAQLDDKGKPIVTGLAPGVVPFNVQAADGTEYVFTRKVDGTDVKPLMYNGNRVVAKQPTFKWEQSMSADGRIRFALKNQQTGATKEGEGNSYEVDPTKFETITTKGVNGEDVILQYPVNAEGERIGDPVPVFRGEGQSKIITIGKSLYQLTPDADGVFTYRPIITGAPEIKTDGKGQLGFVYPPNVSWVDENGIDRSPEENTKGRFVPLTGAEGKAEDFEFKTFVNNSTKRVSTLRRKKGSKQFFDLSSGRPVTDQELSGMTDISGETAYESMTKAEAKGRRRDMLNKAVQGRLQEQFRGFDDAQIESWVDANQGAGLLLIEDPTERAAARQVQIDNLKKIRDGVATTEAGGLSDAIKQSIDIAQAIKKGTGGYAKVKSILNRIASTGANLIIQPFGGKPVSFGRDEELAREYVRSFAILFRIAAANSPRFAEGEQGRLALLLPDVEKLLTSPQFELDKLRIFKQNLQAENIFIKKKLAYASDLSSSVISNLENAEQAIELALGMMPDVIPPGVRPTSGMPQQKRRELMRLQEEGSQ